MKKTVLPISLLCFVFLFFVCPSEASDEAALAATMGNSLISVFKPERAAVRIRKEAPEAWIEIDGGEIDGIKIEKMRLLAELKSGSAGISSDSEAARLAAMIKNSTGEAILAEKDVNEYFRKNENPEGFSDLEFDFGRDGFTAAGRFRTKIIVDVELPISAKGILALRNEAVYLENTVNKVEGMNQPEFLTNMILSRINPLIEFKDIPFPVTFEKIIMTEKSAIMTGKPKEFKGGKTWHWEKQK